MKSFRGFLPGRDISSMQNSMSRKRCIYLLSAVAALVLVGCSSHKDLDSSAPRDVTINGVTQTFYDAYAMPPGSNVIYGLRLVMIREGVSSIQLGDIPTIRPRGSKLSAFFLGQTLREMCQHKRLPQCCLWRIRELHLKEIKAIKRK